MQVHSFFTALFAVCAFTTFHCQSATLSVKQLQAKRGTISNQSLSVLNHQEQYGDEDQWDTYIEAAPGKKRFNGYFSFQLPANAKPIESMHLHVNTLGEGWNQQRWFFQVRHVKSKKWKTIGSNRHADSWSWHEQQLSLGEGNELVNYISEKGEIHFRYRSSNNYDVSNIDYLVLKITEAPTQDEPVIGDEWWKPRPDDKLTWQWQINGELDASYDVDMYDVDLFDTSKAQIKQLKDEGRVVVCYFSAGTYESWRPDWQTYFPFINGDRYRGNKPPFAGNMAEWDERWLDIRNIELLAGIMRGRLDMAVEKGCDAVEPDNVDAYTNLSEVERDINFDDQLAYNRWLAEEAHKRGLSIGLKNNVEQLAELVDYFDWALNEQCFQYNECDAYSVFTSAGKAVFGVEYSGDTRNFCPKAKAMGLAWLKKRLSLDAWRVGCEAE